MVRNNNYLKFAGAAQGARRATGAVPANFVRSSRRIIKLRHDQIIDTHAQPLARHVDSGHCIFVDRFRRQTKPLTKDIQQGITPNKTNQVVATTLGLWQRVARRGHRVRKSERLATQLQRHLRRPSLQLRVAITAIVLLLKDQRSWRQLVTILNLFAAQEPLAVMVIELFNHSVPPRLGRRNEPGLDTIGQTQANQNTHPPRITTTAVEDCFVIYLLLLRYPQTTPVRPDSVDGLLPSFAQHRRDGAATSRQVHAVQAVEAHRPTP